MRALFLLFFLSFSLHLVAHEGHHDHAEKLAAQEMVQDKVQAVEEKGRPTSWTQWIGSFHLIALHFPIALINLLMFSELLFLWYRQPIFEHASRFLLLATAIITPITALLGFIYSYSANYEGPMAMYLKLHMCFGIITALLAIDTAFIRERMGLTRVYYFLLFILFLTVNFTGFFGSSMTFGPEHMLPPR